MKTKEEYYESVLNSRKILKDPNNLKCNCPKIKCEWHGKCLECVALQRFNKETLPYCLQPIIKDKIKSLASVIELNVIEKEKTPPEYWDFVREKDRNNNT